MSAAPHLVIPDPMIAHGSFRVLQRTDGAFVLLDERLLPGARTVEVFFPIEYIGGLPDASTAAKLAAKAECERRAAEAVAA